jgi:recombinational DNA repair ATPase RecF
MIKVERISIREFRGIRDLSLNLRAKNFAVGGPNGTGKSGIVDAIEFGLTGSISRLTGKGRGDVSVKAHGPHVNSRNYPEKAVVTLEVSIPNLNKTATITRSIKAPKAPIIVPDEAAVRAALVHAEQHPEISLSRREIIKYVLAEPGVRAKEIQALLQLDDLEAARSSLVRIKNTTERQLRPLEQSRTQAAESLRRALETSELKQGPILTAVNVRRKTLGLPDLERIEAGTSIRDGLDSSAGPAATKVPKVQAAADAAAAKVALVALSGSSHTQQKSNARLALLKLKAHESHLEGVERDAMLATAVKLFDEKACPVCRTEWEPDEFRAVVQAERDKVVEAANAREAAEQLISPLLEHWRAARDALAPLVGYASNFDKPLEVFAAKALRDDIAARIASITAFLPINQSIGALTTDDGKIEAAVAFVDQIATSVAALPEPSARDSARDFLTVGQERLEAWRSAAARHESAKQQAALAARIHQIYGETTDAALEAIYKEVEAEFRKLYRLINGDDESKFEAQLTPSLGKLGFEVDFYGKGFFPPGAYHSEGHQDGMGLCLYLALMKHLLGQRFTLAVLDDVVMSVDVAHRRQVCKLLKAEFPDTQFILTTHDDVWLKHMRSAKLIDGKQSIVFRKWHVDQGPSEWKTADVWAEIDEFVALNDVRAAAGLLRYYLEFQAAEWCARLGGRVEFRSDGRYELGDLLPGAIGALGDLYRKAKVANRSWGGPPTRLVEIEEKEAAFRDAVERTSVEQWQINPAVHYNEWANLTREDFGPVVEAYKRLELTFECQACGDPLYLTYTGKERDTLRCGCATTNFNLKSKPKAKQDAA